VREAIFGLDAEDPIAVAKIDTRKIGHMVAVHSAHHDRAAGKSTKEGIKLARRPGNRASTGIWNNQEQLSRQPS